MKKTWKLSQVPVVRFMSDWGFESASEFNSSVRELELEMELQTDGANNYDYAKPVPKRRSLSPSLAIQNIKDLIAFKLQRSERSQASGSRTVVSGY